MHSIVRVRSSRVREPHLHIVFHHTAETPAEVEASHVRPSRLQDHTKKPASLYRPGLNCRAKPSSLDLSVKGPPTRLDSS